MMNIRLTFNVLDMAVMSIDEIYAHAGKQKAEALAKYGPDITLTWPEKVLVELFKCSDIGDFVTKGKFGVRKQFLHKYTRAADAAGKWLDLEVRPKAYGIVGVYLKEDQCKST
jgi:hypothetical protein